MTGVRPRLKCVKCLALSFSGLRDRVDLNYSATEIHHSWCRLAGVCAGTCHLWSCISLRILMVIFIMQYQIGIHFIEHFLEKDNIQNYMQRSLNIQSEHQPNTGVP